MRSGETHPCHLTCSDVPNDALFMHGTVTALPLRAAAKSLKKRDVVSALTVNGLAALEAMPRFCIVTEPFPSDDTWIA